MGLRPIHKLRRIGAHYRQHGFRHVLEVACAQDRIPAWLYHDHRTALLRLSSSDRATTFRKRQEYHYLRADETHVDELASIDARENPLFLAGLFRDFLSHGASCYAIARQGRIIAYNWLFERHYTLTNDGYGARQLGLSLEPGDTVFGNGFIAPEYRMKGLFPSLIQMAVQDRPATTRFFTTIARLNEDSLRAHQRFGFERIGTLGCHRLLGAPYFWSWVASSREMQLLGFGQQEVALSELVQPK